MIKLMVALVLIGAFLASILYELKHAPLTEEQEDNSIRFLDGSSD
jgi:hypothetical protein